MAQSTNIIQVFKNNTSHQRKNEQKGKKGKQDKTKKLKNTSSVILKSSTTSSSSSSSLCLLLPAMDSVWFHTEWVQSSNQLFFFLLEMHYHHHHHHHPPAAMTGVMFHRLASKNNQTATELILQNLKKKTKKNYISINIYVCKCIYKDALCRHLSEPSLFSPDIDSFFFLFTHRSPQLM